jgi:hypothetical protein
MAYTPEAWQVIRREVSLRSLDNELQARLPEPELELCPATPLRPGFAGLAPAPLAEVSLSPPPIVSEPSGAARGASSINGRVVALTVLGLAALAFLLANASTREIVFWVFRSVLRLFARKALHFRADFDLETDGGLLSEVAQGGAWL